LRRAKDLYPHTVRIVLSGQTELKSITDAINEGAIYKFLTKPWDDKQLRDHIEEAFRRKGMADDNRRLHRKLHSANKELAVANQRLHELLERNQQQIARDETSLDVAQEALHNTPSPVIGVDVDGVIVFVNVDAENLFGQSTPLLGRIASEVLPELAATAGAGDDLERTVEIGGRPFRLVSRVLGAQARAQGTLVTLLPSTPEDSGQSPEQSQIWRREAVRD